MIISGDLQARVHSASRSANGNELTLARERQAKQNFGISWSPAMACLAWLWLLAFFATYYGSTTTTGLTPDGWRLERHERIDDERIGSEWIGCN